LDLLVDPSSNLSTKYTFLYPGLHLIPRTSLNASTVSRSRALLGGDSILLFLSELVELLMAREFCQIWLQILKIQPMLCCCAVMKKGPATLPNQGGEWEGPRNGENAELKFKGLMDIWTASLRLLGAANATGALAAGAAFQAFDKKPEAQSTIKVLVVLFLMGVMLFALSQMAIFFTQLNMEFHFLKLREPSEWEKAFWNIKRQQQQDPLVQAKVGYLFMMLLGTASFACFLLGLILVFHASSFRLPCTRAGRVL
jgi:hypothetical protein